MNSFPLLPGHIEEKSMVNNRVFVITKCHTDPHNPVMIVSSVFFVAYMAKDITCDDNFDVILE